METMNWKDLLYPYEQAVAELTVKFQCIINTYKKMDAYSPIESVSGRVKRPSSILEKAGKKQIPPSLIQEKMEDIAGIRLVCQFVEDIPRVIELIRSRSDMTVTQERDYITNTKPSGYRSYHIIIRYPIHTAFGPKTVFAEIQIRTLAMNFWAASEHSLRYKYSGNIPQKLQDWLTTCAESTYRLDRDMSTIREEIMNAQRLNEIKGHLVDNILDNLQMLVSELNAEKMDELNREFIKTWNEGNIDEIRIFNDKLNVIAELYRV